MEVENVGNKNEKLKYEIASELGLLDKVIKFGWKSLSAKETGRIGGLMSKRKKITQLEKGQQM
jgi:small acid-soluble spore protein F (minor alpha/beta-type SASP)